MLDLAAIASRLAHICSGMGQKRCLSRIAAVCAVAATVAGVVGVGWDGVVYADGGADAREQAAADEGGVTAQGYARGILRALADDDTNRWVRYWRALADCEAAAAREGEGAARMERVLLGLAGMLCARLEARLGVNPGDYMPSAGEERTVGLLAIEPGAAVGYTLFAVFSNNDVFLIDPLGRVAHAWHLHRTFDHVKLLDNGNLLAVTWRSVFEFDRRGNIVRQYNGGLRFHHDFLEMPNGNMLLIAKQNITREEAIAAGANPEFVRENGLDYDYLVEAMPTGASGGEIVWKWSPWDHLVQDFDPSKENYGAVGEHPELIDLNFLLESVSKRRPSDSDSWLHANSVDYNPELDQIMLSARNFSELWVIDHSATMEEARGHSGGNGGMGGDLLYRWGNPRAYGQGDVGDQRLFWQHQTHWIAPGLPGAGNILLFNNGNEFAGYERHYSSVDEIAPPVEGYRYRRDADSPYSPAKPAWTYVAETPVDFYAPILSGAQRLPNGNTLIADGTAGTVFQAAPDGRIVWKYVVPLNWRAHLRQGELPSVRESFPTPYGDYAPWFANGVYRAYWYPPDYPGLQALDLTPGAYIEDIPDMFEIARKAAIAGDFGDRLAGSDFDIYLDAGGGEGNRRLIYIKQACSPDDARHKFFLHIFPADARVLPANRQEYGFDDIAFEFVRRGKASDGGCVVTRGLPGYAIERIRTGQFTDEGEVWRAEIELDE